jgi:cell division protease FtsH
MKKQNKGWSLAKRILPWMLVAAILAAVFAVMNGPTKPKVDVSITDVVSLAQKKQVAAVRVTGQELTVATTDGKELHSVLPPESGFVRDLVAAGVPVKSIPPQEPSLLLQLFMSLLPTLLIIGVMVMMMRRANGVKGVGGGNPFTQSRAKELTSSENTVMFNDVAGCDEAKEDVKEIVDFLRDPGKYQKLGGHIPKGVLMSGPPGTGKTLLARAIAGEAGVPFFSISGSDFVEMFVGVGASRVRDLFEKAKKHAPCIIFIDEIDAVGRHRGAGMGGGNDEREQTLNQMLVEMDGFGGGSGVIVIAATNRPDVLDPALLRPGRFDRQVTVGLPDVRGREQILNVHFRKIPVAPHVSPEVLARGTPGFSGAELANLVNEAALFAARRDKRHVDMQDFEDAKDKGIMGPERKSVRMPESERLSTAYHESGHAVLAKLLENTDPVHKVSIVPRGGALGVTVQLPTGDRYSLGKKRILDTIVVLFGGRLAEELFTDDITTGASNDYERANAMARNLVTKWGMSEALGPLVVGDSEGEPFLGRSIQRSSSVSEDTMRRVDEEVRRILDEQYARARDMLQANRDKVEVMTAALMKWETIDADQVNDIMAGLEPRPPRPVVVLGKPASATPPEAAIDGVTAPAAV